MQLIQKFKKGSQRDKTIFTNALGALGVRGLALIVSLFTTPAYIRFFSDQQVLGVWFTVLAVLTWILSFDLGIGNGLRNKLTVALAEKDHRRAKELISSAYIMIGAVVAVGMAIGLVAVPLADWNAFFNVSTELVAPKALQSVVQYAFIGIMLQFFLRLISSVLYAMQKAAINNVLTLVTSAMQLAYALIAPEGTPTENLQKFAIAYIVCANLPLLVATIVVFCGRMRPCRPSLRAYNRKSAKGVLALGGIFFVCQVLYMVIANTNEFFITQYTDPANVVEYQIYYKIFSLGSMLYMLALTPIWSAVSKALAERDYGWIRKLNRNIFKLSLAAVALEFLLILPLQPLINFWLGADAIQVNYGYALCFAVFGAVMIFQSGVSTIVCGIGRMGLQAVCYSVGIVAKFLIISIGVRATHSWIVVVWANAIILIPYCVLEQIRLNRFLQKPPKSAKKAAISG